jgi:hypothetical protein
MVAIIWNEAIFPALLENGAGSTRGNTMITIAGVPVKTRVPLTAWVIAGVLMLVSLASTLTHIAPSVMVADQSAVIINHQASMN